MLCTNEKTYKLKQSETSNMFMAVDLNKASKAQRDFDIEMTTNVFVEITPTRATDH